MPGKYTSDEEKACIFAWRWEKVLIKIICERSGKGKATIMRLLAAVPLKCTGRHGRRGWRGRHGWRRSAQLIHFIL